MTRKTIKARFIYDKHASSYDNLHFTHCQHPLAPITDEKRREKLVPENDENSLNSKYHKTLSFGRTKV